MNMAREQILSTLRRQIGRNDEEQIRAEERVARNLTDESYHIIPGRSGTGHKQKLASFCHYAQKVQSEVISLDRLDELPSAVGWYLRQNNLAQKITVAPNEILDSVPWDSQPLLRVTSGNASPDDKVGLTIAHAGIAETGTLLLASGPTTPIMLHFLPEIAMVVLPASHIFGSYEDALHAYSLNYSEPPRTLNFVTGPSRTGDIAQKIELGAHGPKELVIFLAGDL